MNKGFAYYFKNAMKASTTTVWKNKNFFKTLAFWFMQLLSFVTLLGGIMSLASVRQARTAKKRQNYTVSNCFNVASKSMSVWTIILAIILEALIILGGVVVISIFAGLMALIGYIIALFAMPSHVELFSLIFAVPGAIVMIVYIFCMALIFSATPYVVENNPGISAGEAISVCIRSMRNRDRLITFFLTLVFGLIELIIIGIAVATPIVASSLFAKYLYGLAFELITLFVCILVVLLLVPYFDLARRISICSLFEDVVLDPVKVSSNVSGINIKKFSGMKFDSQAAAEEYLPTLFDEYNEVEQSAPRLKTIRNKPVKAPKKISVAAQELKVIDEQKVENIEIVNKSKPFVVDNNPKEIKVDIDTTGNNADIQAVAKSSENPKKNNKFASAFNKIGLIFKKAARQMKQSEETSDNASKNLDNTTDEREVSDVTEGQVVTEVLKTEDAKDVKSSHNVNEVEKRGLSGVFDKVKSFFKKKNGGQSSIDTVNNVSTVNESIDIEKSSTFVTSDDLKETEDDKTDISVINDEAVTEVKSPITDDLNEKDAQESADDSIVNSVVQEQVKKDSEVNVDEISSDVAKDSNGDDVAIIKSEDEV